MLYLKGRRLMMFQLSGFYCSSPYTIPANSPLNPFPQSLLGGSGDLVTVYFWDL